MVKLVCPLQNPDASVGDPKEEALLIVNSASTLLSKRHPCYYYYSLGRWENAFRQVLVIAQADRKKECDDRPEPSKIYR